MNMFGALNVLVECVWLFSLDDQTNEPHYNLLFFYFKIYVSDKSNNAI